MSFFITGTDTGVGKTRIAAMIVRAWRGAGVDAVGFKPVCCGDRDDAERLGEAAGGRIPINDVNPMWLRPPLAPYTAAMVEGRTVDVSLIRETFSRLRAEHAAVIVEGVGGWLVPITRDFLVEDLAREFALPVLVVAANRLGALNHALLTVRAVKAAGLSCVGVILNQPRPVEAEDVAALTNRAVLEELLETEAVPLLGEVSYDAGELPPEIVMKLKR
jgi:dethiobiotin synthetase